MGCGFSTSLLRVLQSIQRDNVQIFGQLRVEGFGQTLDALEYNETVK